MMPVFQDCPNLIWCQLQKIDRPFVAPLALKYQCGWLKFTVAIGLAKEICDQLDVRVTPKKG